jgi:hypothetical protein
MRHLGRLAVGLTVVAFVATAAYALFFLLVFKAVIAAGWFVEHGLLLAAVPLVLIAATYLARLGVAKWMLDAGALPEAYAYAYPRRRAGIAIGPTEAAVNRYVAAESARQMGRLDDARAILAETYRTPWRPAARELLAKVKSALEKDAER